MLSLDTDIKFLKGVGEKRAEILRNMGIDSVGALLRFYPRAYENFSDIKRIGECFFDQKVCIKARIVSPIKEQFIRKNMTLYKFDANDGEAIMSVTIFNNKYLANRLHIGSTYLFMGKLSEGGYYPNMSSPEIREEGNNSIVPIYSASAKMSSAAIEKLIKTALTLVDIIPETLPQGIISENELCDIGYAIENIHFPKSEEALYRAENRLVFEELFILQTGLMLLKGKRRQNTEYVLKRDYTEQFLSLLPYGLTGAQLRSVKDCIKDMSSGKIMNRLVQGDVGSGKTAVAAAVMYNAAKNHIQSALMAPTEILASQHYENLKEVLKNTDVNIALVTGSTKKSRRTAISEGVKDGSVDIVIGTQALLSDDTCFLRLGLVITDEQHRFGVNQRAKLASKGVHTHTLVMSATPIPRTLGLIIYGDLDISVIDEYPKGRQQVASYYVDTSYRKRIYNYIKKFISEGRQGYIVCPLVEENETMPQVSAEEYYENLKSGEFAGYRLGLLHGKMKPKEKDAVMAEFKDGNIDLLVCTTVIEVGIDVPNAAIMVIESAERFGLSQLHQLRGRVGRGGYKSSCIFISDAKGDIAKERLNVITKTSNGFTIADEDLRLRGPGDFLGNRQHGLPQLKIADIFADKAVLKAAGKSAEKLLITDPMLKSAENTMLKKEIAELYRKLNEN